METITQKKKKPLWELKISNVKIQLWKNKNTNGKIFISAGLHFYRFPFKFYRKIDVKYHELLALKEIIAQMPEIKVEQKGAKKKKEKEVEVKEEQ